MAQVSAGESCTTSSGGAFKVNHGWLSILLFVETSPLSLQTLTSSILPPMQLSALVAAVREIFACLELFFSQEYALPFSKQSTSQERHLTETFQIKDLVDAMKSFPDLALNFVSKLKFLSAGDVRVQAGVKRAELGSHPWLVEGAEVRVPLNFWMERINEKKRKLKALQKWLNTDGERQVQYEEGNTVTAKVVPLKGKLSRRVFIASLTSADIFIRNDSIPNSETILNIIDPISHSTGSARCRCCMPQIRVSEDGRRRIIDYK